MLRKADRDRNLLEHMNYPVPVPKSEVPLEAIPKFWGPTGKLRASHRVTLNKEKSTSLHPWYDHDRKEVIKPGTIFSIEVPILPIGKQYN